MFAVFTFINEYYIISKVATFWINNSEAVYRFIAFVFVYALNIGYGYSFVNVFQQALAHNRKLGLFKYVLQVYLFRNLNIKGI